MGFEVEFGPNVSIGSACSNRNSSFCLARLPANIALIRLSLEPKMDEQ